MSCLCNLTITLWRFLQGTMTDSGSKLISNILLVKCRLSRKKTQPSCLFLLCAGPSLVVVAVSVYYLIGPHFYFWPHSGNTLCLTRYKFPAFNILTKILSSLSALNTVLLQFLLSFLPLRALSLFRFILDYTFLFWGPLY